jgi:predicted outer membrane protein
MKTLALLSVFLALPLAAQDQKQAPSAPITKATAPVISPELLKEYYKALAHQIEVNAAKVAADEALNKRILEIRAFCGESVELKPDGEPQCKPKPEPAGK